MYVNGKWVPVKAGYFHTSPRGVAHATRTAGDEEIWLMCFFTAPLPPGGDRAMVDWEENVSEGKRGRPQQLELHWDS